jgi:Ca2+-binding EF-hand superfamily protein
MTNLTYVEVEFLYKVFRMVSALKRNDGVIDPVEFELAVQSKYSPINRICYRSREASRLLFNTLDLNKDSVLNFREFIIGFSAFLNSNVAQQSKFLFQLLDYDNTLVVIILPCI